MTPAPPMQRETVGAAVVSIRALLMWLMGSLLTAGDERRQPLHVALISAGAWSGTRRELRLIVLIRLTVPRQVRLRLTRPIRRFVAAGGCIFVGLFEACLARTTVALGAGELRVILPKLLLGRCNDPIIVLGVLIIVLGSNGVAGGLRVARELNVFFHNVRWIAADFHVRSVGLVDARHGVVTLAMVIAAAHPLVLTVSHDWPAANSFLP